MLLTESEALDLCWYISWLLFYKLFSWKFSPGIASDRKISFAVLGMSERSDSIHSSTTSISQLDAAADAKGKAFCLALHIS